MIAAHAEEDMSKRAVILNEIVVFYICNPYMNQHLKNNEKHRNILYKRCANFLASKYCTPTLRHTASVLRTKIEKSHYCDIHGKYSLSDF